MFKNKKLQRLDDYFTEQKARKEQGIYFYRINGYHSGIRTFIGRYYETARLLGVVIEGKIPNPDEKNLAYYDEIMGSSFQLSLGFITSGLKKWLPRMNDYQRSNVASSMYDTLDLMRKSGKNDNMLRNAYIKFMCWLYYKFERIVSQLGNEKIPKILYEGDISNYELKLISILAKSGCDVVLLQYKGDGGYLKADPKSELSMVYEEPGMQSFPAGFSIKTLREELVQETRKQRLYGIAPQTANCTNAWIKGEGLMDILTTVSARGSDSSFFYNAWIRINGVEDKLTYKNELYQFGQQLKGSGRKLAIINNQMLPPDMDEISSIQRGNYRDIEDLVLGLSKNIYYVGNTELQRLMVKSFVDIILEEGRNEGNNINKLTNTAVYLLCWLKRYQSLLFGNWKPPQIPCLIYLGGCKNKNEVLFFRMMARLPVDILILVPDLNTKCMLTDPQLYEKNYDQSMTVSTFPLEQADIVIGTAAYHAERELDTLMYQDSGMYRNMQYGRAVTLTLQTMYEEIAILWDQELKYRPNFSTVDGLVNIPVIYAKISGVKDSDSEKYWQQIKILVTSDTLVVKNQPMMRNTDPNPIKQYATEFYKNGKLQKERIKSHKAYQYDMLRDEMQEHILEKLKVLIDQRIIKGTMENGTEYTIVSVVLNLGKDIIRMIQKFDFTKKNPKLIYINTTENVITLEDSIITSFLNLIGFDVLFFVPTGYQNIEKHLAKNSMEEHHIGDYMYDLNPPDFNSNSTNFRQLWRDKIFRRNN